MAARLLFMPAQIIQMMAFAHIMDIWRPGRSMEDHLKVIPKDKLSVKHLYYSLNHSKEAKLLHALRNITRQTSFQRTNTDSLFGVQKTPKFRVIVTLSEQMAHSTVDLHLKEISEFLHTRVGRSTYTHKIQPLRIRPIEPFASESVPNTEYLLTIVKCT